MSRMKAEGVLVDIHGRIYLIECVHCNPPDNQYLTEASSHLQLFCANCGSGTFRIKRNLEYERHCYEMAEREANKKWPH